MLHNVVYTKEQEKAIKHQKGHLRIIACPGSGKTQVVSERIARLIERGADPKTIVAFTFTEKAAEQLKTRIRGILDERCPERADFGDMFVGTIHAFCFFMLKEIDPSYRSYDVLDEPKRIAFLAKKQNFYYKIKLVELMEHHDMRFYPTIYKFLDGTDIIMTEDINPSKLSDKIFRDCYLSYRKLLDEEKYFDFSSIMHEFVKKVKKDRKKLKTLNQRVKHVILDEYQDVNTVQEMLLEILSHGAESVCVVGDDDQNIYHWRGSDVSFIRSFKERYGKKYKVTDVKIGTNFRSTDAIIHTAQSFIEHNKLRLSKKMVSSPKLKRRYENGDIVHHHFENDDGEFGFMVDKIKELHKTDFLDKSNKPFSLSYTDFAVLARTNDDAARTLEYLDAAEIPCVAHNGISIFERPVVVLAMDCIGYVFGCRGYNKQEIPELDELQSRYNAIFSNAGFPNADSDLFVNKLEAVRRNADKIFAKSPKDYFGNLGLQGFYYMILNAMGTEDFDFGEIFHFNLAALSQAISDYESVWVRLRASQVEGFFFFVYAYARSHYMETQHSDTTLVNAVNVLTIHGAKGLEFPVVFMPNFEKKRHRPFADSFVDQNLYNFSKYNGDEEDERRVYYTAITRSEKYLYITGSKRQNNRVKDNYVPHQFLDEIDKKYFSNKLSLKKPSSEYKPKVRTAGVYPTSFSHLSTYDRCPQDFRLRNVFGYNAGVPVTFGYGSNVHNALNVIHSDYIHAKKIPSDQEIEKIFDKIFKMRYATPKIAKNMKKAAVNAIKNYVRLHRGDFNRILETEKNFEFVIDEAIISGQIDLLKRVDKTGRVTEVEIIDFKTEKKDGVYNADHEKQLRFYAIACLESLGLKPDRAYVHHIDQNEKSYVDISEKMLDKTKDDIKVQVKSVLEKKFPAKPNKDICEECDYKLICPMKDFKSVPAPTRPQETSRLMKKSAKRQITAKRTRASLTIIERAKMLAKKNVVQIDGQTFRVKSGSDKNKSYTITDNKCACLGYRNYSKHHPREVPTCSHIEATRIYKKQNLERKNPK